MGNIDDKSRDHEEDDRKRRGGGRDRGYQGPTSSFSEKKGYKPEVTLEYVDDTGRAMNAKEAFRFLSHKFHGKGSGKLKTEKRHRKVQEVEQDGDGGGQQTAEGHLGGGGGGGGRRAEARAFRRRG